MTRDDIVHYWIDSSDHDYQVMESLFNNDHYVWCLFVGHLVVEKLLKAYHVKNANVACPQIHNLLKIAESAALQLSGD